MSDVCWAEVTGVVPVGAVDDATLIGGLGRDGKKASPEPFVKTAPLVGNVGDPREEEEEKTIGLGIMCE